MSAFERHYSIREIAEMWHLSVGAVRALLRDRSDVLRIGEEETRFKRGYVSVRVPASVVERVYAELQKKKVRK